MLLPFLLALVPAPATADAGGDVAKGAALLHGCQAELRLSQPEALQHAEQGDLVNGAYCVGYVNGFLANLGEPRGTICTHEQPLVEVLRSYVDFMAQNPGLLERDKRVGLRLALEHAYPCPAAVEMEDLPAGVRRNRL